MTKTIKVPKAFQAKPGQVFLLEWAMQQANGTIYTLAAVPSILTYSDGTRVHSRNQVYEDSRVSGVNPSMAGLVGLAKRGLFDVRDRCFYTITDRGREVAAFHANLRRAA